MNHGAIVEDQLRGPHLTATSPDRYATTTACARSRAQALARIRSTCVFAVDSAFTSTAASSALDRPSATRRRTSRSRSVRSAIAARSLAWPSKPPPSTKWSMSSESPWVSFRPTLTIGKHPKLCYESQHPNTPPIHWSDKPSGLPCEILYRSRADYLSCRSKDTVPATCTEPVCAVVTVSIRTSPTSCSAIGLCSTPRGTTKNSPGPSLTSGKPSI